VVQLDGMTVVGSVDVMAMNPKLMRSANREDPVGAQRVAGTMCRIRRERQHARMIRSY
jgi:hypothetical protein